MKKLLLCALLPLGAAASSLPHGYTAIRQDSHHRLRTGPHNQLRHLHQQRPAFFDGTLHLTGLIERQFKSSDTGRFLGTQPNNTSYTLAHINTAATVAAKQADATNNLFVHADPAGANDMSVTFTAKPSRTLYGLLATYEQYIPLFGGWYVGAQTALVDNHADLNIEKVNSTAMAPGDLPGFFAGHYYSDTAKRRQEKLKYNQFDTHSIQRGGISNIDLWLRKPFLSANRALLDLRLLISMPTISPVSSQYLYTPTLGSNGHWEVGSELHAALEIWRRRKTAIAFNLHGYLGYTLSKKEPRIPGISSAYTVAPFGQYALLTNKTNTGGQALQPAANLLHQEIRITPGLSYEGTGSISWQGENLHVLLGYTFHGKEGETAGSWHWYDDTYAIAGAAYNTENSFAGQTANVVKMVDAVGSEHTYVQKSDLDINKALLPPHELHTFWLQLSYSRTVGALPLSGHIGIAGTAAGSSWQGHNLSGWASMRVSF